MHTNSIIFIVSLKSVKSVLKFFLKAFKYLSSSSCNQQTNWLMKLDKGNHLYAVVLVTITI